MRLIDADAMYERACSLEAQALDYVGKLIERDGDEFSVEWKIWSAILTERTAFKHDVFDAPTIEERKTGKWSFIGDNMFECTCCGTPYTTQQLNGLRNYNTDPYAPKFCPNCGADMRGDDHEND